jgi:hypothetical protein
MLNDVMQCVPYIVAVRGLWMQGGRRRLTVWHVMQMRSRVAAVADNGEADSGCAKMGVDLLLVCDSWVRGAM